MPVDFREDATRSRFLEALLPAHIMEAAREAAADAGSMQWKWAGEGLSARGSSKPLPGNVPLGLSSGHRGWYTVISLNSC